MKRFEGRSTDQIDEEEKYMTFLDTRSRLYSGRHESKILNGNNIYIYILLSFGIYP